MKYRNILYSLFALATQTSFFPANLHNAVNAPAASSGSSSGEGLEKRVSQIKAAAPEGFRRSYYTEPGWDADSTIAERFKIIGVKGYSPYRFNDTDKPNAVVILPAYDGDPEKADAFYVPSMAVFLKGIMEKYDMMLQVASNESEVYAALDRVKKIELAVFSGHGSKTELSLDDPVSASMPMERYNIGISDAEIRKHFKNLSPNAVVFLFSCLSADGGPKGNNLANFIADAMKSGTVIAGSGKFKMSNIKVRSYYPFDANIINPDNGEDVTYSRTAGRH